MSVASSQLRAQLATSTSNFSHLLGDLSRAALVERIPKGQEVWARLTERGHRYALENHLLAAAPPDPIRVRPAVSDRYRLPTDERPLKQMLVAR